MQFSIIIPTRDRAALLRKTLLALHCQQYNSNDYEVIVVNNNPHDLHTSSIIHDLVPTFPQLRFLTEVRRGASHARNLGCKHAKAKHLIFIDDDILVKPEFLQGYTSAWKKYPKARVLGGAIYSQLEDGTSLNATQQRLLKEFPWCFAHHNNFKDATPMSDTLTAFSANMSYRQKKMGTPIFTTYLGTTPNNGCHLGAEDLELCLRTILSGETGVMIFNSLISVTHLVSEQRFSSSYISKRSWLAGIELAILEQLLTNEFSSFTSYYRDFVFSRSGLKAFLLDPYQRLPISSYLLKKYLSI